jgi:plastocyanin
MWSRTAAVAFALVACGDDAGTTQKKDAAVSDGRVIDVPVDGPTVDTPPDATTLVRTVTCPSSPDADIAVAASGMAYNPPAVTIMQNQIVRFNTMGSSSHDVAPHLTLPTDPGVYVPPNQIVCKQFTVTGPFHFRCRFHLFEGMVTVN